MLFKRFLWQSIGAWIGQIVFVVMLALFNHRIFLVNRDITALLVLVTSILGLCMSLFFNNRHKH